MPAARRGRSAALLAVALGAPALFTFTAGPAPVARPRFERSLVALEAEPGEKTSSMALVKVNEENSVTTAGVLGGLVGLFIGGVWVGGALFAASSYLARKKDDDLAAGLKGIAAGGLEALNYVDYLNVKYEVTDQVGSALSNALGEAKSGDSKETVSSVTGVFDSVTQAITSFDKDVGIKDTLGGILSAGVEMSSTAVNKVFELNEEYKVTDQLKAKIDGALNEGRSAK
ncbi:unnamed protein product [Polarella glacialis]|uniref:H(+)-exporting diphosphatase n=1 Tax=Polarella glacialis TaxID=89957 RepID=A0A813GPQ0_POLGL|nr:unnamed protein product [Polarella glacialis]CAE8628328.1 unnamed protein product [Polarella glacialis]